MANEVMDCKGLKCPQPVLKLAIKANSMSPGDTIEIHADCESFPQDVEKWCADNGKVLINIVNNGSCNVATVQF